MPTVTPPRWSHVTTELNRILRVSRNRLPATTRTVEMSQIAELNRRLADHHQPVVTVADLPSDEVTSPTRSSLTNLPESAILVCLTWDGSPSFPNIYGYFTTGSTHPLAVVDLHTAVLKAISHRLHLRQAWGVGPPRLTPRRSRQVPRQPPSDERDTT